MTAQEYIHTKLNTLNQPAGLAKPSHADELVETIARLLLSKKFRKYSASPELIQHIKSSIRLHVEKGDPINITFTHGAYKLWRLEESPEVDWAELFAFMYYTNWLKPVCEIYEPGVHFDSFVDDLILPTLNNLSMGEVNQYKQSYRALLKFLKPYQPTNFTMTITGTEDLVESPDAFYKKLETDTKAYAQQFKNGLPAVSDERAAMVTLNARPSTAQNQDPQWLAKNVLVHDAYISHTKRGIGYTFRPEKILAFTQPLPSGVFLAVGSTKDSIAKFWSGVGTLRPRDDSYRQLILSPNQLAAAHFDTQPITIENLTGRNFQTIRVLKAAT